MKLFRIIIVILMAQTTLWSDELRVTTLLDIGGGTLRDALNIAQEDDVIIFDSILAGIITLLSPLPPINASIKIFGPPSGGVSVSGNTLHPAFQVNVGNVEISDLHVLAAVTLGSGAGLFIGDSASVIFLRGSFNGCIATGAEGGAVHVGQNATFNSLDTTFLGNVSGGPGDDVFLDTDSSFIYSNSGVVLPIEVFGTGNLFKNGLGTVTFTIPASTPLSLIAQQGETISTGTRTEPTIIQEGARLEGSQESLYIANHGTLKPSTTIGTTVATDDYYQAEGATLEVAVTPLSNDLLDIGGNAFLHGDLSIDPDPGVYTIGTTYVILTTGGFVNQQFGSVSSTSLTFQVNYFPQSVEIEITGL